MKVQALPREYVCSECGARMKPDPARGVLLHPKVDCPYSGHAAMAPPEPLVECRSWREQ